MNLTKIGSLFCKNLCRRVSKILKIANLIPQICFFTFRFHLCEPISLPGFIVAVDDLVEENS